MVLTCFQHKKNSHILAVWLFKRNSHRPPPLYTGAMTKRLLVHYKFLAQTKSSITDGKEAALFVFQTHLNPDCQVQTGIQFSGRGVEGFKICT